MNKKFNKKRFMLNMMIAIILGFVSVILEMNIYIALILCYMLCSVTSYLFDTEGNWDLNIQYYIYKIKKYIS